MSKKLKEEYHVEGSWYKYSTDWTSKDADLSARESDVLV